MNDTMFDYILEQPEALQRVFDNRKEDAEVFIKLFRENRPSRIFLIGSGSSLNAAKAAAPVMESLLKIEVTPVASSAIPIFYDSHSFLIFISQGGNSTNTIAAIKSLASYPHMALTGSESCTVNDITDHVLIRCGEEKAGPKTKGYVSTIFALTCAALEAAKVLGSISSNEYESKVSEFKMAVSRMSDNIQLAITWLRNNIEEMKKIEKCVVIGKHIGQAGALESALKLQETMLIPATGYEYEEFLHGADMAIDEKMAGLYLLPEQSDPDHERFVALINYHRTKCPFVYTVGGGEDLNTVRDLSIGTYDKESSKILSWCLPSQLMGAKIPSLIGKEGKGTLIFRELDAAVSIKAKHETY